MALRVRLWINLDRLRSCVEKRQLAKLWLFADRNCIENETWKKLHENLSHLVKHDSKVHELKKKILVALRRSWDKSLRAMAQVRKFS